MEVWYVLKDTKSNKYYSNDKAFIEPNKKFAKRLRMGQAKSLQWEFNRTRGSESNIVMEQIT